MGLEKKVKKQGEKQDKKEKKSKQVSEEVPQPVKAVKVKKVKKPEEKKPEIKSKSKINRFQQQNAKPAVQDKAVLYIGHLPYGFGEDELKKYFEQYGTVTQVKLCRSRKTARSKGYGFVEFDNRQVAEIAAKSMQGYIMLGRQLICQMVGKEQKNPFDFAETNKEFKFINWSKQFREQKNADKSTEEIKNHVKNLLKNENKKRKQLEELKISYEFPGFSSLLKHVKI